MVRALGIRRDGSAALKLCYLANGRFDGFRDGDLAPWDTAAGTLIDAEAGGRVTDYAGRPFRLVEREIRATDSRLHEEMMGIIAGV